MENETKNLPTGVRLTERFTSFLADNHEAFALSDSERGETNADALSRNPVMKADLHSGEDIQVAVVKGCSKQN